MKRPIPKDPNRVTIQEKFALDTGGTVTGKGKHSKEMREYLKQLEEEEAKRAKEAEQKKRAEEAAKNSVVASPEEGSAPEQQ
ncbi:hypothetical protein [Actinomyces sp. HMSC065F11]|uniref:hypothetical protein n=1 Tax=Actinomyces sp. HMSC065F11 TaxID=1739395 RepID=UPI0008A417DC|nr:hypothetical protein [Actinomyces sp. HMSC065F11]OFR32700.1 hypothetical protein HMPREF2891_07620 [Actinomyces sp. HMSC065F11]